MEKFVNNVFENLIGSTDVFNKNYVHNFFKQEIELEFSSCKDNNYNIQYCLC